MKEDYITRLECILKSPKDVSNTNIAKLFHYTSNKKKEKIVTPDKVIFKLSRISQLLDRNEGYQILEPYYHACGELYQDGTIDRNFYELLTSVQQNDISKSFVGMYVLCFSKNGNSSFMKRRYAAGDGWILGGNLDKLEDICIDTPDGFNCIVLYEVKYSFMKIVRFIKNCLKKYYDFYKQQDIEDSEVKGAIVKWLSGHSLVYKATDYKFEEEIRLVCKLSPGASKLGNNECGVQFEIFADNDEVGLKMIFDKKWLIYESQDLEPCFDLKLNKNIISKKSI